MDTGARGVPRREIRVSDAERDQAVAELSEHFQSGRLTQEEFEDRSGRALQARTVSDLAGLFNDLPHNAVSAPAPAGPVAGPRMRLPLLPVIILGVVIAAIIGGHSYGGPYHHNGMIGLLVPVIVLSLVCCRLAARRR
jgi:Domain of unknown function (DUF1707)